MKKITFIITILILIFSPAIYAQSLKGSWIAAAGIGNISFSDHKTGLNSEGKTFAIHLYPQIGYLFTNRFAAGASLDFSYENAKIVSSDPNVVTKIKINGCSIDFSPFIRYYIPLKSAKNRFYGQIGVSYGTNLNQKTTVNSYHSNGNPINNSVAYPKNTSAFSANGTIGFEHFFTKYAAFNTTVYYYYERISQTTIIKSSDGYSITQTTQSTSNSTVKAIGWSVGLTFVISGNKKS